jgi:ketosteroid isomerase-like protein
MKQQIVKGILLSISVMAIVACNSKHETATIDKEQIKKEIQAKEDEYAELYNSKEFKNIGYYADDAVSFAQNKQPLIGKQAIIDYYIAGIDPTKNHKISFTTNEVFPSADANQVVEIGHYKLVDSADIAVNSGNYMILFEKRNGKYESVREMSASDMAF